MSSKNRVKDGVLLRRSKEVVQKKISPEAARFAQVLRQIVDPHALLIMRELSLGVRRFQAIQAQTQIGSHLLSSRLRRLEKDGIIERRRYCEHPPRFEYFATVKGGELDEVLFAAINWNLRWDESGDEPSLAIYDKITGERLGTIPPAVRKRMRSKTGMM